MPTAPAANAPTDDPTPAADRLLLVTGASGFIGGKLTRAALQAGWRLRLIARDPDRLGGLADDDRVTVVHADLCEPNTLAGACRGVDAVIHSAGILGKWGTPEAEIARVNVGGTRNLLECAAAEAPTCRFLHLSAGGVSGPAPHREVDETYDCKPATAYERTKLEAERWVVSRGHEIGMDALVVRPTFTYGPGDPHKLALFRAVRKGRYAFIGRGDSVLHPVYCDDLVRGVFLALERGHPGEVYILGGERPISKRELVATIADTLGVPCPRAYLPRPLAALAAALLEPLGRLLGFEPILTRSRVMMMGDNFGYSIEKARRELGYRPATDLQAGIALTVAAYRDSGLLPPAPPGSP